jgi:hypothetical protein
VGAEASNRPLLAPALVPVLMEWQEQP